MGAGLRAPLPKAGAGSGTCVKSPGGRLLSNDLCLLAPIDRIHQHLPGPILESRALND